MASTQEQNVLQHFLDMFCSPTFNRFKNDTIIDVIQSLGLREVNFNTLDVTQISSIGRFFNLMGDHDGEMHEIKQGVYFYAIIQYSQGYVLGLTQNFDFFDTTIGDWRFAPISMRNELFKLCDYKMPL